ncbi:MAG: hypothetical protein QOG90_1343 [Actinomycetota bacterium]|jgi:hypothetical protein
MGTNWRRNAALCAVLGLTLATSGCRGSSDDKAALETTTTALPATTTTAPSTATVLGATLDASTTTSPPNGATTTAKPKSTPSTTVTRSSEGATVSDAPRDAHTENSDNSGSLTFSPTPTASSSTGEKAGDPLEFTLACQVASDGHGQCNVHLVNHVTRAAQFPGGLKVTVTMERQGASPVQFVFAPGNVPSLQPGEAAEVEGTIDLYDQGTYTYSATTTVAWP